MGKHLIIPLESQEIGRKSSAISIGSGVAGRLRRTLTIIESTTTFSSIDTGSTRSIVTATSSTTCTTRSGITAPWRIRRPGRTDLPKSSSGINRTISSVLISVIVMALLGHAFGVPTPGPGYLESLVRNAAGDLQVDAEDVFAKEEESLAFPGAATDRLDDVELDRIRRSIVEGLGLDRIPDPSKANVSQAEYERAHREYLKRTELSHVREDRRRRTLHTFQPTEYFGNETEFVVKEEFSRRLYFPVELPDDDSTTEVEHANLRFLLDGHEASTEEPEVLVYQVTNDDPSRRRLVSRTKLPAIRPGELRWVEFDVSEAAASWLEDGQDNLGLVLRFRHGGHPRPRNFRLPTLNLFTTVMTSDLDNVLGDGSASSRRHKRAIPDQLMSFQKGRRTECRGDNKKCCRHRMTVIFKDLKGFEFIIQPKTFDAGYCKGRCPPRYNPAHHHALLQSLIWKEDRKKAPRPCCAPSKLAELEILYFDENDSTKLKISNWKNMRVLECACS
ncbi:bone morphogenetic protein 4 [Cephus cinctus]|uniref:Bone morphogenetic protein 4 n=1 Tax=Cephus cinctus TaxID=211228 RepID=A0AAJ7RFS0_CEPCN|nr:bone morphogenetic protein 4 [Cephus cinctus]XP_024939809.1 bone morphogenetic protein 4 [Cephus cinctus]